MYLEASKNEQRQKITENRQRQRIHGATKQEKDKYIHAETSESKQGQKIFGTGEREKENGTQKYRETDKDERCKERESVRVAKKKRYVT